jgi:transposase
MTSVAVTRTDLSVAELRARAKQAPDTKQARRILAIAMVLDGFSRQDAAEACGMQRQTLRDWVHRYNQAGLDGLADRARSGRPACLTKAELEQFATWVEDGADLSQDGVVRFRRVDLRDKIASKFAVYLHERSVGKLLRQLGYRRLSVRPLHPQSDPAGQETFKKTSPTWRARRSAFAPPASRSKSGSATRRGSASKAR